MKLLALKGLKGSRNDAFIRQDASGFTTLGFEKTEGNFVFIIDSLYGEISNCHSYLKYDKEIKNAGIFRFNEDSACLYWYLGDKDFLLKRFKSIYKFNVTEEETPILPEEVLEAEEVLEEETPVEEEILTQRIEVSDSFWDCNKESYLEILDKNPENQILNQLIPGSRWVNVIEDNYAFGVIYDENDIPMYLCYGFSLPWSETPPEKLEGYCQWIPLDFLMPHEEGYWVIYINANTGERVK